MNREKIKNEYYNLTDELEALLDEYPFDAAVPALVYTLGTFLASSGCDKDTAINFVVNGITKIYAIDFDEEDE